MKLALFDFVGTITTKDSLKEFIQFAVGKRSYYLGLFQLSPMLAAYTLKLIPNHIAKENLISHFFKGLDSNQFQKVADQYSLEEIDKIVRPKAMQRIRQHQEEGYQVVMVSASMEKEIQHISSCVNIHFSNSKLETKDNKLTGKFLTKNCYGIEKANRVQEVYNLSDYDYIYAYGDSRGDKELLELADESFYKPFKDE